MGKKAKPEEIIAKLRQVIPDLTLDNQILQEVIKG